jgi:hypothetical protein
MLAALDPADRPLIVTLLNDGGAEWAKQARRLERWGAGTTFALLQLPDAADPADIAGAVRTVAPADAREALARALALPAAAPAESGETERLAANPQAPWRHRAAGREST